LRCRFSITNINRTRYLGTDGLTAARYAWEEAASWYRTLQRWSEVKLADGRCSRSEEIAQAVCFLASNRKSFTNGTALTVDGAF
jgi:NAD(P)-dependent dehydrogenase (short-subunit alcohol dehydrogenase family)